MVAAVWVERMTRLAVDENYLRAFNHVLAEDQIADPAVFLDVDWYDAVPVYSYHDQLDYLSDLPFAEANRVLIRCTVLYLERIVAFAAQRDSLAGKTILRMVSVTGWQDENDQRQRNYDGTTDFVTPYIWLANLDHPGLSDFALDKATSPAGRFTQDAVNADTRFAVAEGKPDKFGQPSPTHVYIYMLGSEGTRQLLIVDR
jgi:hypothetical protein